MVPFVRSVAECALRVGLSVPWLTRFPESSCVSNEPLARPPPSKTLVCGATVNVIEPQTEPAQALIVVVPDAMPKAWP
jgi:hypothetical protein